MAKWKEVTNGDFGGDSGWTSFTTPCDIGDEGIVRLTSSNVEHPSHYNQDGIECIEAIKASLGDDFPAYCKGNVMKYLWRYKYKNGLEDLKKAQVYLNWMVEAVEDKEEQ